MKSLITIAIALIATLSATVTAEAGHHHRHHHRRNRLEAAPQTRAVDLAATLVVEKESTLG